MLVHGNFFSESGKRIEKLKHFIRPQITDILQLVLPTTHFFENLYLYILKNIHLVFNHISAKFVSFFAGFLSMLYLSFLIFSAASNPPSEKHRFPYAGQFFKITNAQFSCAALKFYYVVYFEILFRNNHMKGFLRSSLQNPNQNTCAGVSFFRLTACNIIKNETPACEFSKTFQGSFL